MRNVMTASRASHPLPQKEAAAVGVQTVPDTVQAARKRMQVAQRKGRFAVSDFRAGKWIGNFDCDPENFGIPFTTPEIDLRVDFLEQRLQYAEVQIENLTSSHADLVRAHQKALERIGERLDKTMLSQSISPSNGKTLVPGKANLAGDVAKPKRPMSAPSKTRKAGEAKANSKGKTQIQANLATAGVASRQDDKKLALLSLRPSELQNRAAAAGATSRSIEQALDDERDPKAALIELILAMDAMDDSLLSDIPHAEMTTLPNKNEKVTDSAGFELTQGSLVSHRQRNWHGIVMGFDQGHPIVHWETGGFDEDSIEHEMQLMVRLDFEAWARVASSGSLHEAEKFIGCLIQSLKGRIVDHGRLRLFAESWARMTKIVNDDPARVNQGFCDMLAEIRRDAAKAGSWIPLGGTPDSIAPVAFKTHATSSPPAHVSQIAEAPPPPFAETPDTMRPASPVRFVSSGAPPMPPQVLPVAVSPPGEYPNASAKNFGGTQAPSPALPPNWEQLTEPASGKPYFFNHSTCESRWTPPPPLAPIALGATPPAPLAPVGLSTHPVPLAPMGLSTHPPAPLAPVGLGAPPTPLAPMDLGAPPPVPLAPLGVRLGLAVPPVGSSMPPMSTLSMPAPVTLPPKAPSPTLASQPVPVAPIPAPSPMFPSGGVAQSGGPMTAPAPSPMRPIPAPSGSPMPAPSGSPIPAPSPMPPSGPLPQAQQDSELHPSPVSLGLFSAKAPALPPNIASPVRPIPAPSGSTIPAPSGSSIPSPMPPSEPLPQAHQDSELQASSTRLGILSAQALPPNTASPTRPMPAPSGSPMPPPSPMPPSEPLQQAQQDSELQASPKRPGLLSAKAPPFPPEISAPSGSPLPASSGSPVPAPSPMPPSEPWLQAHQDGELQPLRAGFPAKATPLPPTTAIKGPLPPSVTEQAQITTQLRGPSPPPVCPSRAFGKAPLPPPPCENFDSTSPPQALAPMSPSEASGPSPPPGNNLKKLSPIGAQQLAAPLAPLSKSVPSISEPENQLLSQVSAPLGGSRSDAQNDTSALESRKIPPPLPPWSSEKASASTKRPSRLAELGLAKETPHAETLSVELENGQSDDTPKIVDGAKLRKMRAPLGTKSKHERDDVSDESLNEPAKKPLSRASSEPETPRQVAGHGRSDRKTSAALEALLNCAHEDEIEEEIGPPESQFARELSAQENADEERVPPAKSQPADYSDFENSHDSNS